VFVIQRTRLAFDEDVAHFRSEFEGVTVGDDDVGNLTGLERANLIGQSKDLRRI